MTSAEIQTLLDEVKCYACLGLSLDQLLTLGLERRWLLTANPNADTSVAALMASANCTSCYGMSAFDLLETALLGERSIV